MRAALLLLLLAPVARASDPTVPKIIDAALAKNDAWTKLEHLCDDVGNRLSGSEALGRAVDWAVATLEDDDQEHVHLEPVMVPRWVRGAESLALIEPRALVLPMLGLGNSVGTPPEGITAEVAVVTNEAELDALGDRAKGKIILFNNPMSAAAGGSDYGTTVRFRVGGAKLASAKGAVAYLVRSVTAANLRNPHTGVMSYKDAAAKIPAAAITGEDADMLARFAARGRRISVHLTMAAHDEGLAPSNNVVAELRGREHPEEVVVIGGHLDSWDVGQGAQDDGAGVVIAMEALNVLRRGGFRPRRTVRVVLWVNEENGLAGGEQYAKDHADELKNHVAAIESDSGAFAPKGFAVEFVDKKREAAARDELEALLTALAPLGATTAKAGFSGADVSPMHPAGVPALGLSVDGTHYFDVHHSQADTLDKVDPKELSRCVAAMAAMAWMLAEMPGRLGATAK